MRESRFGADPVVVLAQSDEQLCGMLGSDATQSDRAGCRFLDECVESQVDLLDLSIERENAPCDAAQSELGGLGRIRETVE